MIDPWPLQHFGMYSTEDEGWSCEHQQHWL